MVSRFAIIVQVDPKAAAEAINSFLRALGHEPVGELAQTGQLVAEAWHRELLDGYGIDGGAALEQARAPLGDTRPGLVLLRDLDVTIMCPHHLLPAHGRATVAYLPTTHVAGLGAIAKALNARAHRLSLQETVGAEVAQLLVDHLQARGALCQLRLTHTCLLARGARQTAATVETLALAGSFAEGEADQALALAALQK